MRAKKLPFLLEHLHNKNKKVIRLKVVTDVVNSFEDTYTFSIVTTITGTYRCHKVASVFRIDFEITYRQSLIGIYTRIIGKIISVA